MNVLIAVSEAAPFAKTGGLADVAGSLPQALCARGIDARVILPLYGSIAEKWRENMRLLFHTEISLSWRRQYCGVFALEHDNVTWYFIDNEYYFKRDYIYGGYDDGERFAFFSRAVTEILPLLDWQPEIIHCNDWQTAAIPLYLTGDTTGRFQGIKTIFTIHNIEYQGRYNRFFLNDVLGFSDELYDNGILRFLEDINLMKGAIYKADRVTTVSPSYAQELRMSNFACGLHAVIEDNAYKLSGILNGIDTRRFNPQTDRFLAAPFDSKSMAGKARCRQALCEELGLMVDDDTPIIACISRLVGHKGFDLVADALEQIVSRNACLVILGTGDERYEHLFREAEHRHQGRVSASIMYSEKRASMVYGGADMLLMPSRSEPCGLTQMIAMRYGTVPIVRAVGGLRDSIRPYPQEDANGFSFYYYSTEEMMRVIDYALSIHQDSSAWADLVTRGMEEDLSWNRSAKEYESTYAALLD